MTIPTYQEFMLPMLKVLKKQGKIKFSQLVELLGDWFNLSADERGEMLTSGRTTVLRTRVHWAKAYMKQAGLVQYPQRGYVEITTRGKKALDSNPKIIDTSYLRQFSEFIEFINRSKVDSTQKGNTLQLQDSPEEMLADMIKSLKKQTQTELLEQIKSCSWQFFEDLVVGVIVSMGYGGTKEEARNSIKRVGDEGVDGVINEDPLGLDSIYLQAKLKRTGKKVGRPEVQQFYGALEHKKSKKGIFITTTDFSKDAQDCVEKLPFKIVLIPGLKLVDLMWEYNIGLESVAVYDIKKLKLDFFNEE
ncbi:TPA: restriction endonuclease [Legionella pneumophila]|uniref:restriction endonuclease n=1 Tax=Legionella pneumophila TaxID=446 RepID=UPI000D083915|nr:restriction endonuclease [Legionella pneumophila]HAU1838688.1 restriction endonuclease [Legionella pneumophila]HAW6257996.1 restriction endonuclease [Legionella pneumophila]HAW6264287.1 restriction endonuclease [Legionella pneumophila]HBD7333450.1 restriction endonuclease [Legionella pneumophila]HCC0305887.1 restriction endonuclease [Legionella pneumophila]